ncbi:hypothetical protein H4J59_08065 [Colwellia sp. MB02u-10]|nr:hypothetical protein [Colwellia sp. MB02u-10]
MQSMKCHTGEYPTGVATQDEGRQRGLIVPEKVVRVEKFHDRTIHTLKEILSASDFTHTSQLQPSHFIRI